MKKKVMTYQVKEIPDPSYPQYQLAAGGDVISPSLHDFEHLLRFMASLPPGSAKVSIKLKYDPRPDAEDMQSRLSIYVEAHAFDRGTVESLKLLFEHSPLTRFYRFEPVDDLRVSWEGYKAACEVFRRETAITPLYKAEFNPMIPEFYYTINLFKSDDSNDYINLERVLGRISEQVIIDLYCEPVDVSSELSKHTKYLSQLQSINRGGKLSLIMKQG